MKTILIVDGDKTMLTATRAILAAEYTVGVALSAQMMFNVMESLKPDLILLDIAMPGMSGLQAMVQLHASEKLRDIPIIILTEFRDAEVEAHCLELGAVDVISKLCASKVLLSRVKLHLGVNSLVKEKAEKLKNLQGAITNIIASLIERKDKITGGHLDRTAYYLKVLMSGMVEQQIYAKELERLDLGVLFTSARLHDVGKIVVPDAILNKPGSLTKEEFEIVKTHASEGERIIAQMIEQAGDFEFLSYAYLFAGYHHERWDGTGYPHKLQGEDIPLLGRVMAVVDVYDALISERPYKKAISADKAVSVIKSEAGSHFDAKIIEVFSRIQDKFKIIS